MRNCTGASWWLDIMELFCRGLVVYTEPFNGKPRFGLLNKWLPNVNLNSTTDKDARVIVLKKYLKNYAPATIYDFVYWSGFKVSETKIIWNKIAEEIKVERTKEKYYILKNSAKSRLNLLSQKSPPSVLLLPKFDPYLLGHKNKERYLDERYKKFVFRPVADISAVLVVNHRICGIWKYKFISSRFSVEISLFSKINKKIEGNIISKVEEMATFFDASKVEVKFIKNYGSSPK